LYKRELLCYNTKVGLLKYCTRQKALVGSSPVNTANRYSVDLENIGGVVVLSANLQIAE
jgi:hypothetical protein